jgi:hypothetical protein
LSSEISSGDTALPVALSFAVMCCKQKQHGKGGWALIVYKSFRKPPGIARQADIHVFIEGCSVPLFVFDIVDGEFPLELPT